MYAVFKLLNISYKKNMLDKLIENVLDFIIEDKMIENIEKIPAFHGIIQKLKDKPLMIHIIKYLFFGVVTTILSIGSFALLIELTTLNENICNFISIVVGILSAYVLNRQYVFESKEKNILKEFSKFLMARVASSVFDMASFFVFATCLKFNEMVVKIIISIVVVILNYFLSKLLVFCQKEKKNA